LPHSRPFAFATFIPHESIVGSGRIRTPRHIARTLNSSRPSDGSVESCMEPAKAEPHVSLRELVHDVASIGQRPRHPDPTRGLFFDQL
jgi:hypothetical protein